MGISYSIGKTPLSHDENERITNYPELPRFPRQRRPRNKTGGTCVEKRDVEAPAIPDARHSGEAVPLCTSPDDPVGEWLNSASETGANSSYPVMNSGRLTHRRLYPHDHNVRGPTTYQLD